MEIHSSFDNSQSSSPFPGPQLCSKTPPHRERVLSSSQPKIEHKSALGQEPEGLFLEHFPHRLFILQTRPMCSRRVLKITGLDGGGKQGALRPNASCKVIISRHCYFLSFPWALLKRINDLCQPFPATPTSCGNVLFTKERLLINY